MTNTKSDYTQRKKSFSAPTICYAILPVLILTRNKSLCNCHNGVLLMGLWCKRNICYSGLIIHSNLRSILPLNTTNNLHLWWSIPRVCEHQPTLMTASNGGGVRIELNVVAKQGCRAACRPDRVAVEGAVPRDNRNGSAASTSRQAARGQRGSRRRGL